ncbi:ABC transporter ATP-binding protein [Chloroflexota bacterium]
MPEVKVKNINKSFGKVKAVDGVTFEAMEREFLTLLGPSGCGKSTTLRLIAGLEKLDAGEIRVGNKVLSSRDMNIIVPAEKRGMGMVFQSYGVWPHMSVFDNVAFPLSLRRIPKSEIRERVRSILDLVGLNDMDDRPGTLLSGGQQQRVALARALVHEPEIVLFDEPLSNLDAKLREQMRLELKALQRRIGITAIYVTHDQSEALALSDRIIVMNKGHIEQMGTPWQIYEMPETKFVMEFVGQVNWIKGKIMSVSHHAVTVDAIDEEGLSIDSTNLGDFRKGEEIKLCIRPEDILLHREKPIDKQNVIKCTITRMVYLGDRVEYIMTCGNQTLKGSANNSISLKIGDTAYIEIEPQKIKAFREDN